ncbi:helix-turn-helix transcriptional regulator [Aeromicrobium sp. 179-A 4D2 NHS]|uniref:helix-turn-helix transcriptional regulator n=1 Tax=Aeromicrobium sp. 179-A 4D2 NHS TaxID=3142375 RepID=UPI00399F02EB
MNTTDTGLREILSIEDLAAELQIPKRTIYNWRAESPKKGPKGFKVGKHLRFHRADVDKWYESLM